ncbi:MAG: hypothetical protein E5299_01725 [Burkholderia gladioli]|nr:MAG: hypothetical protein E5299_01725 [Burkholderia gladioli]
MDGFLESTVNPRHCWFFQFLPDGVTTDEGRRYYGRRTALLRTKDGVTTDEGRRYYGRRTALLRTKDGATTDEGRRYYEALGLLIFHLFLAYSLTVQPTAARFASALRAVCLRFFMVLPFVATSGQI